VLQKFFFLLVLTFVIPVPSLSCHVTFVRLFHSLTGSSNISSLPLNGTDHPVQEGLRQLIASCLKNDRKAQRQLYDTYSPAVYGAIRRYVAEESIATEVLNEAFYRILTRLGQYGYQGAFEGWMRRIAVHAVTDYYRRNKKHEGVGEISEREIELAVTDDAVGRLSYKELLAQVHSLPDTQRTVFNLFVFEQYAHKDIAQLLDMTESNSRWHLNDARRRLKEKITTTR